MSRTEGNTGIFARLLRIASIAFVSRGELCLQSHTESSGQLRHRSRNLGWGILTCRESTEY